MNNVSTYCLNLITLEMIINNSNNNNIDLSVFPCFKNLNVRKLVINVPFLYNSNMFKRLANNLSNNIKEISFQFIIYRSQDFKRIVIIV